MFLGFGKTLPQIANLPGPSRPGHPSGGATDERLITVWRTTAANETVTIPFQYGNHNPTTIAQAINYRS